MSDTSKKKKSLMNTVENVVFAVLFVAVVILLISVIMGTSPFFFVQGISMHPTLENGDLIVIDRTPFDNLKIGDIIIYNKPEMYPEPVVHKIIKITFINQEEFLFTKGDNNQFQDPLPISRNEYKAKYIGIRIPYAGFLGRALAPPVNYIIIVLLILYLIYDNFFKSRKKTEEKIPPLTDDQNAPTQNSLDERRYVF
jgi:signal peptidase